MEYTLLDKIKITRPILFLCGPYYQKSNESDRRLILQENIYQIHHNKFLPLVIDDFLTEDNIKDDKISIQLMEEICAAVSAQTYIFLDTMSSAAELGIFANSAFFNKIKVYIPKISDIYNKKNVGYFVRDVVLKKHLDRVECLEYRPEVERNAIATDYILEYYKFVNNQLPRNIQEDIREDSIFKESDEYLIEYVDSGDMPDSPYQLCYQIKDNRLDVKLSIKLLFYITVSVVSLQYKEKLKTKDFSIFDIKIITEQVKKIIVNFLSEKTKKDLTILDEFNINTVLKEREENVIRHIVKFVHIYYLYSRFHSVYLMEKPIGKIVKEIDIKIHPYTLFNLSDNQINLLKDINKNTDKYYEQLVIKKNKKKRELIKYKDDDCGVKAKELHGYLLDILYQKYKFNQNSYAYQKGKSIKQCVDKHIKGKGFIKYDIKKFFENIQLENLSKCFAQILEIDNRFLNELDEILKTCFYRTRLPLGLVMSPILSDMYLSDFDDRISSELEKDDLVYTRYADDIMISSKTNINQELHSKIQKIIEVELNKVSLSLNTQKSTFINFDNQHKFIRYVGINIIQGENGNYLSVGKNYIYSIAKEYLRYQNKVELLNSGNIDDGEISLEELKKDIFYERMIIIGKVGFLKQIEGERGYHRLEKRLKKYVDVDLANI